MPTDIRIVACEEYKITSGAEYMESNINHLLDEGYIREGDMKVNITIIKDDGSKLIVYSMMQIMIKKPDIVIL